MQPELPGYHYLDFIAEGDNETVKWIQKALGWTLTGAVIEKIPFLYGEGGNRQVCFQGSATRGIW